MIEAAVAADMIEAAAAAATEEVVVSSPVSEEVLVSKNMRWAADAALWQPSI